MAWFWRWLPISNLPPTVHANINIWYKGGNHEARRTNSVLRSQDKTARGILVASYLHHHYGVISLKKRELLRRAVER